MCGNWRGEVYLYSIKKNSFTLYKAYERNNVYIFIEIHDRIGGYPYKTMVLFVLVMILLNSQVQILFKRLDREY